MVEAKVWTTKYGSVIYIPYTYRTNYEDPYWDPYFVHFFFTTYWSIAFAIVAIYIVTIYGIKQIMAKRKAFELRKPLILWNTLLAIFSILGTARFSEESLYIAENATFVQSVCNSFDPHGPAAFWATAFTFSKIFELVDTVFLLLRKRPLIFLHWYHHAVVLIYSWHGASELVAASRWFIGMNYAVHSLMYTYYALSSAGFKVPRSVAAVVTMLQTGQMLIGVMISIVIAIVKYVDPSYPCQQSANNLILCFIIYASFAALFMRFFVRTYFPSTATTVKTTTKKED